MRKFMITLTLPSYFTDEFVKLIPKQRAQVMRLLTEGKLASFSLSAERTQVWMVVNAKDEDAAESLLESFPMYDYFDYEIIELAMYDVQHLGLPQLMLN